MARSDLLILAALLILSATVRIPYLWDVPRLTDESNEALKALLIAHGRLLALTNVDPYIGPLWNYLLAGVFLTTGPSLYTPRTVVALLGILTVVPTYLLGRSVGGQGVGVLAAVFLALSPVHIVVNSHIGWSNCVTPLLTTLALWLTHRSVTRAAPSGLAWAGMAWGLALQTHPVAFLFLPGVVLYVVQAHPRWMRSPWPWLATGLAVVACSPLLVANVRSGFGGLDAGLRVQEEYAAGEPLSIVTYGRRLGDTLSLLSDGMSGALSELDALRGPLGAWLGLIFLCLTALSLGYSMRRRRWLLVVSIVTYCLLLPVINARFAPVIPKARYVAPILPLCYIGISMLAAGLHRRIGQTIVARRPSGDGSRIEADGSRSYAVLVIARDGLIIAVVAVVIAPVIGLHTYLRDAVERGRTNTDLYAVVAAVNEARRPSDQILVDRSLFQAYAPGGGRMSEHLRFAASVYGWDRQPITLPISRNDPLLRRGGLLVVPEIDVGLALTTMRLQTTDAPSEHGSMWVFRVLGPNNP